MKKVFVSYSSKDKWVRTWLEAELESYGVEVLIDYKTFLVGKSSLENIELAVAISDYTFFVLTDNWIASEWTMLENLMVQGDSPANQKGKFFILRLEACNIPPRLKPFTYLDLTDPKDWESHIQRLLNQLGIHKP